MTKSRFGGAFFRWNLLLCQAGAVAAVAVLGQSAPAQLVTGDLTGSVTANYSSSTDNNGDTTYSFVNASANLNLNVPVIPVSATQSGYWTDPLTWNGAPIFLFNDGVTVAGTLSDLVGALLSIPSTANTLINDGPTEQTVSIPGLSLESNFLGVNASFNVGANLSYDVTIPTDIDVTMDQPTVAIHSLFIESGATLTGNGNFTVRTDLTNEGTLYGLGGTIQGNFNNTSGAFADVTSTNINPLYVEGTFLNFGTLSVESSASVNLSQPSSNDGTVYQYGGTISVSGTFTNDGTFNWYAGTIPNVFENSMAGVVTVNDSGTKSINSGSVFNNFGTITQTSSDEMVLSSQSTINNIVGAVYDIQGDGGMGYSYGAPGGQSAEFNNAGTVKKSGGTGTSVIGNYLGGYFNSGIAFNNTGTIEVDSGTLSFQGGGSLTGGNLVLNSAGTIAFSAGVFNLNGNIPLIGTGSMQISGASLQVNGGNSATLSASEGAKMQISAGGLSTDATSKLMLAFTGSSEIQFSGGSINGFVQNIGNLEWSGGTVYALTNAADGLMSITGSGQTNQTTTIYSNGVLNNAGSITQTSTNQIVLSSNSVINNLTNSVYDIQSDGGMGYIYDAPYGQSAQFNNAGLFEKSAGTGTSIIGNYLGGYSNGGIAFNNTGTVEVDSGTLNFQGGGSVTGGNVVLNGTGTVAFAAGVFNLIGNIPVTGTGSMQVSGGSVEVNNGNNAILSASGGATLQISAGSLGTDTTSNLTLGFTGSSGVQFSGGSINGSVQNLGNLQWSGGTISGLTNAADGNMTITGAGQTKVMSSNGILTNTGIITQTSTDQIVLSSVSMINNLMGAVYDLQSDGGMGYIYDAPYGQSAQFNNAGLFEKSAGTGTSIIGNYLGGYSNGGIAFNNTGTVEIDSGTLEFDGGFTQTAGITAMEGGNISGSLNFQGGLLKGSGTITGSVTNSGAIISPGNSPGTITIIGNYQQNSMGTLMIEMAGSSPDEYDLLNVEGTAYLAGTLDISLLDGFRPTLGETFQVLDFNNVSGKFATIDVLDDPAYQFALTYNGNNLSLTTTAVPEPGALGLIAVTCLLGLRRRHSA